MYYDLFDHDTSTSRTHSVNGITGCAVAQARR